MRKYLQLVFLAVSVFCSEILLAESRDPVRILDLRTLNELDLKEQEKAEQLWDITFPCDVPTNTVSNL